MRAPVVKGDVVGGRYRVEDLLGYGGMGMVFSATDSRLGQRVAIKFLVAAADARAVARFVQEAQAVSRLRSEHVVRVLELGELAGGTPYMVLEYLHGEDLSRTLVTRGALPVSEAIGHVLQASEAIAEAHGMGIIHRDLKPANLFLATAEDGTRTIKVLDFGISKLLESDDRRSFAVLTRSHEVLGTPSFMAPEQLRSARDVDARADVWSMGVILYQLLTGKLPFGKHSLHERLMMVARGEPPPRPRHHRPDLPLAVDAAIMRCLEYNRERRFAGVSDFAAAITPYRSGLWTEATADTPPPTTPTTPTAPTAPATLVTPAALSSNRDAPTVNELPPARSPGVSSRRLILLGVLLACAVALFGAVHWTCTLRRSGARRRDTEERAAPPASGWIRRSDGARRELPAGGRSAGPRIARSEDVCS